MIKSSKKSCGGSQWAVLLRSVGKRLPSTNTGSKKRNLGIKTSS
jgi:hypothetical protein